MTFWGHTSLLSAPPTPTHKHTQHLIGSCIEVVGYSVCNSFVGSFFIRVVGWHSLDFPNKRRERRTKQKEKHKNLNFPEQTTEHDIQTKDATPVIN